MRETIRFEDVLPDLFGLEGTKGWIEVFSTDPDFAVNARVANVGVVNLGLASLSVGFDADGEGNVCRSGVAFYASRVDSATGDAVFILP